MNKQVYIFLFDGFSDWEIAYLTPELKKSDNIELIYFSKDGQPVLSMGGLRVTPEISLEAIKAEKIDLLILPGGTAWEKGGNREADLLVETLFIQKKTVAAICGATIYLAQKGFLDSLKHTSNDLGYLKWVVPQYRGENNYLSALAVTDQHLITASGIAPIEFAREIFRKLELAEADIDKWYQLFKNGIYKAD